MQEADGMTVAVLSSFMPYSITMIVLRLAILHSKKIWLDNEALESLDIGMTWLCKTSFD